MSINYEIHALKRSLHAFLHSLDNLLERLVDLEATDSDSPRSEPDLPSTPLMTITLDTESDGSYEENEHSPTPHRYKRSVTPS